jgi:hypothetical protein
MVEGLLKAHHRYLYCKGALDPSFNRPHPEEFSYLKIGKSHDNKEESLPRYSWPVRLSERKGGADVRLVNTEAEKWYPRLPFLHYQHFQGERKKALFREASRSISTASLPLHRTGRIY